MIRICTFCSHHVTDTEECVRDSRGVYAHIRCVEDAERLRQRMLEHKRYIYGPTSNPVRDRLRKEQW